jgi:hypothetical protein
LPTYSQAPVSDVERGELPFVDRLEAFLEPHRRAAGCVLFWCGSLVALFYYLGTILRDDMYAQDMPIHTPWAYRLLDPSLYPNDAFVDYLELFSPAGVRAVYFLGTRVLSPMAVGELSALPLCALALSLLYRVGVLASGGRRVGGWLAILLVSTRMLDSPSGVWFHMFQGNLARSYAFPVLLWGCCGALSGQPWVLGAACLLGALFYPPTALILGSLCGLLFLYDALRRARIGPWIPALLLAAAGAAYLGSLSWAQHAQRFGKLFTLADALRMPEFGRDGPLSSVLPVPSMWGSMVTLRFGLYTKLLVVGFAYLVLAWRGQVSRAIGGLGAAIAAIGLALFIAAYAVLLKLYEPARYVYLSYYLASILWSVPIATLMVDRLGSWIVRLRLGRWLTPKLSWSVAALALVGLSVGSLSLTLQRARAGTSGQLALVPSAFYSRIRQLPKSSVIAGHPVDISDLSLFTQRSVYVSNAALYPYFDALYARMHSRMEALFQASFARDWRVVEAFARDEHVDYLVVNSERYGERRPRWFATYDREWDRLLRDGKQREIAVLNPPASRVLARVGQFSLLEIKPSTGESPFRATR